MAKRQISDASVPLQIEQIHFCLCIELQLLILFEKKCFPANVKLGNC